MFPCATFFQASKNTLEDSLYLQKSGLADEIRRVHQEGKLIFGICGGYQLLGTMLHDPNQVESTHGSLPGVGLLNVETYFENEKTTTQVIAKAGEEVITGYEIHMGKTVNHEQQCFSQIFSANEIPVERLDGAISSDGRVIGTYLHGVFDNSIWRRKLLNQVRQTKGLSIIEEYAMPYQDYKNLQYDKLADLLRENLDMEKIYQIMEGEA